MCKTLDNRHLCQLAGSFGTYNFPTFRGMGAHLDVIPVRQLRHGFYPFPAHPYDMLYLVPLLIGC